jgi:mannan endo-1,4-beta-mannosidase
MTLLGASQLTYTATGLSAGKHTATVTAVNAVGESVASNTESFVFTVPNPPSVKAGVPALTRSGTHLQVNGTTVRWGGANAFWLGLDDNGGLLIPAQSTISNALEGCRQMGAGLVRSHTIGQSAGTPLSYETAAGVYSDAHLAGADWAVYQAGLKGLYLMPCLTDNWNYYAAGKWVFCHWAYQQNPSGLVDCPGTVNDDPNERQFFAMTAGGLRIRALFKDYISHWLNHVNPFTGLAYKDDPTLAIIETGNELEAATAEWTEDIASYVKSIAPDKLVADGSIVSWNNGIAGAPGLTSASVDVVGFHYYPSNLGPFSSVEAKLASDVQIAMNANKVFIIGEFPWTRSDTGSFLSVIQSNPNISADLYWTLVGTINGNPEGHGGGPGGDDVALHWPYVPGYESAYATGGPMLARHASAMSGDPLPGTAGN